MGAFSPYLEGLVSPFFLGGGGGGEAHCFSNWGTFFPRVRLFSPYVYTLLGLHPLTHLQKFLRTPMLWLQE